MTKHKTISYHESHMRNNKFGSQISQLWSRLVFLFEDKCRLLLKCECLCLVIMEKVMVHISNVSHVKPLSKDYNAATLNKLMYLCPVNRQPRCGRKTIFF